MDRLTTQKNPAELARRKRDFLLLPSTTRTLRASPLAALSCVLALMTPGWCIAAGSVPEHPGLLPGADAGVSELDFQYRLTGDASLKPLRVYNNSITTTIEFPTMPNAKPPTLNIEGVGEYLNSSVKYAKDPDRLIVDGLFDSAELIYASPRRGKVTIERLIKTGTSSKGLILQPMKPAIQPPPQVPSKLTAGSPVIKSNPVSAVVVPSIPSPPSVVAEGYTNPPVKPGEFVAPVSKPLPPPVPTWSVSPRDRTIRETLKGWSITAGWTFEPEYWTLPVDIPVTASATFSGDFKAAVRQLIATTELSDTPSQPCFYLNRVVRVVPINQVCNQMSAR